VSTKVGQLIRNRRRELQLTQEGLEELAQVSQTYISMLETGQITRPEIETLRLFADSLNIPMRDLMIAAGWLQIEPVVVTEDAVEVAVLGDVPGPVPSTSETEGGDAVIRVLPEMIGRANEPFALRATDNEWMQRGIVAGNYVLCETFDDQDGAHEPEVGQLVAVEIDREIVRLVTWSREGDAAVLDGGQGVGEVLRSRAWARRVRVLGTYIYHLAPPPASLLELATTAPESR